MKNESDTAFVSRRLPLLRTREIEWPTLGLFLACLGLWSVAVFLAPPLWLGFPLLVLALVLHSSITHEVLHGHPFRTRWMSEALVVVNPGLAIPYLRFRDTHLAHHQDACLTDPYDDPETNYMDPAVWQSLPEWRKVLLRANNTLLGRMLIGPLLGQVRFMNEDGRAILHGDRQVLKGWLVHVPGSVLVIWLVWLSGFGMLAYLGAVYIALGILKIRTFLEHQAHEQARGRTVIIEDRGLLAFLFLNNNLHVVHHMHPRVPWYRLPRLYRNNRARYLRINDGYRFGSYLEVFRRHFLSAKDPVPHPLWPKG